MSHDFTHKLYTKCSIIQLLRTTNIYSNIVTNVNFMAHVVALDDPATFTTQKYFVKLINMQLYWEGSSVNSCRHTGA